MIVKRKAVKFGWCLTGHHTACPGTFKSTLDGKTMECSCTCHKDLEKELEDLL